MSEKPKDEPVAWGMEKDGLILDVICPEEHEREEGKYTIPLYTHPKKWVGLTDEEIKEIVGPWGDTPIKGYTRKMFDKIEDKLKEKNGY